MAVVQTVPLPPLIAQVIGVANVDFAGWQEVGGRFRMSGSEPWRWPAGPITDESVQPPVRAAAAVLGRAVAILPALARAGGARVWGGLVDLTPDGLPVIERTPEVEGLVVTAGCSGHGFCLGPVTGQIARELALDGRSSLPIEPFRRSRFTRPTGLVPLELQG